MFAAGTFKENQEKIATQNGELFYLHDLLGKTLIHSFK